MCYLFIPNSNTIVLFSTKIIYLPILVVFIWSFLQKVSVSVLSPFKYPRSSSLLFITLHGLCESWKHMWSLWDNLITQVSNMFTDIFQSKNQRFTVLNIFRMLRRVCLWHFSISSKTKQNVLSFCLPNAHTFSTWKWLIFNSNFTTQHFFFIKLQKLIPFSIILWEAEVLDLTEIFLVLLSYTLINRIYFIWIRQPGYNSCMWMLH